jgi:DeoR/GlpR family transcriptional regulator of sugar metabolism
MLDKEARALVGAATVESLRSVRADVLVLGICSLHPEIGITVLDLEESYVKRIMIANAAEVVAVSSAVKLDPRAIRDRAARGADLSRHRGVGLASSSTHRAAGVEVVFA